MVQPMNSQAPLPHASTAKVSEKAADMLSYFKGLMSPAVVLVEQ